MLLNFFLENTLEAGVDEAGRGCYAGPVVAAAVILPNSFNHALLNDSKKMKRQHREALRKIIEEQALAYSVAFVDHTEIDQINILQATYKAMHCCIQKLKVQPELLLIDGNRFKKHASIPHHCIVKGDGKYQSIAAASVLAKTYRDEYMQELSLAFPHYGWEKNMGYGTAHHRNAIEKFGVCGYHRQTFNIHPQHSRLENE